MARLMTHRDTCRVCGNAKLQSALSFGATPLANAFLSPKQLHEPETFFPLEVMLCGRCGLLQLMDIVSPELLFSDYLYASSTSPVFRAHFEEFAADVYGRFKLNARSLVVDIGSNDGILLKPFQTLGTRVLGVDPARTVVKAARKAGIPTELAFFSSQFADKLKRKYGRADVITATNVFAHVDDIAGITQGVKSLLTNKGVFILEVPHLVDFLEQNIFDTVYHEHLSYFSVTTLREFFKLQGMTIIDVQKVSSHGGSLRVFVQRAATAQRVLPAVGKFIQSERKYKLKSLDTYRKYAEQIQDNKQALVALLTKLKRLGKTIAGYGAPAKGNTLLNIFGIGPELITYIVDDSPLKQGRFTPGKRIPVVSSQELKKNPPDYLFIIAWNFAEPIMLKQKAFKQAGGKFILPIPKPKVV